MLGSKEAEEQVDNQVEGKRRLFHCNCDAFSPLPLALELRRITNHTPPLCPLLGSSTNLHHCLWMWGVTASCRILPGFCPSTSGACKSPFTTCFLDSPSLGLGLSSGRSRVLFACSTRVSPEILSFNQPLPWPPSLLSPSLARKRWARTSECLNTPRTSECLNGAHRTPWAAGNHFSLPEAAPTSLSPSHLSGTGFPTPLTAS